MDALNCIGAPLAGTAVRTTWFGKIVVASLTGLALAGGCSRSTLGPMPLYAPSEPAPMLEDPWGWKYVLFLHDFVRDGQVDYAGLLANPDRINALLISIAEPPGPKHTGHARTAHLLNAYNLFAIRAGLEQYRRTLGNPNLAMAPAETDYRFRLHGRDVTLARLRERLLPDARRDARVVLALCPARQGLPVPDRPFTADILDKELERIGQAAVRNPDLVEISHEDMTLRLAHPFGRHREVFLDWYRRRMGATDGTLFNALLTMATPDDRALLNTAVGYPIEIKQPSHRLNAYTPKEQTR